MPGSKAKNGHANGTDSEANGHDMELDGPEEDPVRPDSPGSRTTLTPGRHEDRLLERISQEPPDPEQARYRLAGCDARGGCELEGQAGGAAGAQRPVSDRLDGGGG